MVIFEQFYTSSSGEERSAGIHETTYRELYFLISQAADTFTIKRDGKDSLSVSYREQRVFILGEGKIIDQLVKIMAANLKVYNIMPYDEGFDSGKDFGCGKSSTKNNPYNQMTQPAQSKEWNYGFEDGIKYTRGDVDDDLEQYCINRYWWSND